MSKALSEFSSLRTGGVPPLLNITIASDAILNNLVKPETIVLGYGSNIVISSNISQPVLLVRKGKLPEVFSEDVEVDAGVIWDDFVEFCCENEYYGCEFLSGIPSTVGGAAVQNIGAYGQEISKIIKSIKAYNRITGNIEELSRSECKFTYRDSLFKHDEESKYFIISVKFNLSKLPILSSKDFYSDLSDLNIEDTIMNRRLATISVRKSKSMVLDPKDEDSFSAGSFFVNPILEKSLAKKIYEKFGWTIDDTYSYDAALGTLKVSAARILHAAGFDRGQMVGKCRLSTKHVLSITNPFGASGEDVVDTAKIICEKVYGSTGLEFFPEPKFIGFKTNPFPK